MPRLSTPLLPGARTLKGFVMAGASKCILLVDFDNIFIGLWALDKDLAVRFASQPKDWIEALSERYLIDERRRRWLVMRCYLNPAGYVTDDYDTGHKLFFTRFRPLWVGAGFEVVDTPTLTRGKKNAADIRIVIDALDLLQHRSGFEEFVIASGDSDFTPLLQRLRADDRLVTVMAPGNTSSAYTSLAERIIDFDAITALVRPENPEAATERAPIVQNVVVSNDLRHAFAEAVVNQYQEANAPLNLARLSQSVARSVPGARESNWLGAGSFTGAIDQLNLPHVRFNQHYMWDDARHQEPAEAEVFFSSDQPETVEMLSRTVDMPRLDKDVWPAVFDVLAEYAATHEFNMTDSTRWTRDALAAKGISVGRGALGYIVRGAQLGGAPLNATPPPSAEDIANAMVSSLVNQAYSAGISIDSDEEEILANWLGLSDGNTGDGG